MGYTIKDIVNILGIKKRTVIFWCEEYGLYDFIEHNQSGNIYSDDALFYLKIIKLLKKSGFFSSNFIKKWINYYKCNKKIPCFPEFLNELESELLVLLGKNKENKNKMKKIEDEILKLEEKLKNNPDNEDIIMQLGETYRIYKGDKEKAKKYYKMLVDMKSSKFSTVAKLMIDVL